MMHIASTISLCVLVSVAICIVTWSLSELFQRGEGDREPGGRAHDARPQIVMMLDRYRRSTVAQLLAAAWIVPGPDDSIRFRWNGNGISGFHCVEDVKEAPPAPIQGCDMFLCCGSHTVRIVILSELSDLP